MMVTYRNKFCLSLLTLSLTLLVTPLAFADDITSSPYWKNQLSFPNDLFQAGGPCENEPAWVKFTMLRLGGYDPNLVYYQDCNQYSFHYEFATELLDPFIGLSLTEFYDLALYESGQQAILGAVILPPLSGDPLVPDFNEYGIQFIRYDPYTPQEIVHMFNLVKSTVLSEPDVNALYFPAYEQLPTAEDNQDWLDSQGVIVSSPARWSEGNVCYSQGWALGRLKFVPGDQINAAYQNGDLLPTDILITDGVPAEIPFVAGILTLSPSTPNSHVAILAQTFAMPFAYLAVQQDIDQAQSLIGRTIFLSAGQSGNVGIKDVEDILTEQEKQQILAMKTPPELNIQPVSTYGSYCADTNSLLPSDIRYFGGKAANYGILRQSIDPNCPDAIAFSFDLWNQFLDQPITPVPQITLAAGEHILFWVDDDPEQGPTHTTFKLSADGEDIAIFDIDGTTFIDGLSFGPQADDISYGRTIDGGETWQFFTSPTPGWANSPSTEGNSLVINEFMADNETTIQDPNELGEYPDWIELYNASDSNIVLNGMYLTDDINDPTKYQIPVTVTQNTLREEIEYRLSQYTTYPPADMQQLSRDITAIRSIFKNPYITTFSPQLQDAVIDCLQNFGFDPFEKIRFRSSTNVEDSEQFTGAGLYDSYSGCLADDLDHDDLGPCACDASDNNERGIFRAIRKVFASFYNENAFLERLRHDVNEAEVGMALLVHHSFPDEFELANGVATLEKTESDLNFYIRLVTQKGAVSVANPQDGSIPEVVDIIYASPNDINAAVTQSSNLVILGQTVLDWQGDYNDLSKLLVAAANQFQQVTGKAEYILDFEYKKVAAGGAAVPAGGMIVKQIRQLPPSEQPPTENTPLLINEPLTLCVPEYEVGLIESKKTRWTIETKNMWLTPQNLQKTFLDKVIIEYVDNVRNRKIEGKFEELPFHSHTFSAGTATETFIMHHLLNPRTYTLIIKNIPTSVSIFQSPIVTLDDIYEDNPHNELDLTCNGLSTPLRKCFSDVLWNSYFTDGQHSIDSYFYMSDLWGLQWSMSRFDHTDIFEYTQNPIFLESIFSQYHLATYHNWSDQYVFIPLLEPGISQEILDELKALDIGAFHVQISCCTPPYYTISTYSYVSPYYLTDVDGDGDTDLKDFAKVALRWQDSVCDDCGGADLTGDGRVDTDDILELTLNWLDGTGL